MRSLGFVCLLLAGCGQGGSAQGTARPGPPKSRLLARGRELPGVHARRPSVQPGRERLAAYVQAVRRRDEQSVRRALHRRDAQLQDAVPRRRVLHLAAAARPGNPGRRAPAGRRVLGEDVRARLLRLRKRRDHQTFRARRGVRGRPELRHDGVQPAGPQLLPSRLAHARWLPSPRVLVQFDAGSRRLGAGDGERAVGHRHGADVLQRAEHALGPAECRGPRPGGRRARGQLWCPRVRGFSAAPHQCGACAHLARGVDQHLVGARRKDRRPRGRGRGERADRLSTRQGVRQYVDRRRHRRHADRLGLRSPSRVDAALQRADHPRQWRHRRAVRLVRLARDAHLSTGQRHDQPAASIAAQRTERCRV